MKYTGDSLTDKCHAPSFSMYVTKDKFIIICYLHRLGDFGVWQNPKEVGLFVYSAIKCVSLQTKLQLVHARIINT